jgi:hypothetical protein
MDALIIEGTKSSPNVRLDPTAGVFEICGQSYPENAAKFYDPVIRWLDEYLGASTDLLTLTIRLVYLNTSSSKMMLTLFDRLDARHRAGKPVQVRWHYDQENEMARECGEEFSEELALPIELVEDPA